MSTYDFEASLSFRVVLTALGDGTVSAALFDEGDLRANGMPSLEVLNAESIAAALEVLVGAADFDRALAAAAGEQR